MKFDSRGHDEEQETKDSDTSFCLDVSASVRLLSDCYPGRRFEAGGHGNAFLCLVVLEANCRTGNNIL